MPPRVTQIMSGWIPPPTCSLPNMYTHTPTHVRTHMHNLEHPQHLLLGPHLGPFEMDSLCHRGCSPIRLEVSETEGPALGGAHCLLRSCLMTNLPGWPSCGHSSARRMTSPPSALCAGCCFSRIVCFPPVGSSFLILQEAA